MKFDPKIYPVSAEYRNPIDRKYYKFQAKRSNSENLLNWETFLKDSEIEYATSHTISPGELIAGYVIYGVVNWLELDFIYGQFLWIDFEISEDEGAIGLPTCLADVEFVVPSFSIEGGN